MNPAAGGAHSDQQVRADAALRQRLRLFELRAGCRLGGEEGDDLCLPGDDERTAEVAARGRGERVDDVGQRVHIRPAGEHDEDRRGRVEPGAARCGPLLGDAADEQVLEQVAALPVGERADALLLSHVGLGDLCAGDVDVLDERADERHGRIRVAASAILVHITLWVTRNACRNASSGNPAAARRSAASRAKAKSSRVGGRPARRTAGSSRACWRHWP